MGSGLRCSVANAHQLRSPPPSLPPQPLALPHALSQRTAWMRTGTLHYPLSSYQLSVYMEEFTGRKEAKGFFPAERAKAKAGAGK